MFANKKTIFFIMGAALSLAISYQSCIKAGELEDFSSFLEGLMGGDSDYDEEHPRKKSSAKKDGASQATAMPTPEQLASLTTLSDELLIAAQELILTTHPHHPSWGGAVYESIKQHRHNLTNLESLILHIQAIISYLPAKEVELFTNILKKHSTEIFNLIAALNTLPSPKPNTLEAEDAFILGKTSSAPGAQSPQEQKRRINGFAKLSKKIEVLCSELQKTLASPELKKIFPEPVKPADYKPKITSNKPYYPSISRSSSKNSSSSRWSDDDYGSPYSSDYPYRDYDNYYDYDDNETGNNLKQAKDNQDSDAKPENDKTMYPPKEKEAEKPYSSNGFVDAVKELQDDDLVTTLQKILDGGSMLSNPDYFSTLATTFENLFAEHKDAGLTNLANKIKQLDKELSNVETFLKETKAESSTQPQKPILPTKEAEEAANKQKKEIADATEAKEDYLQAKQGITSALIRLRYLPTEHRVRDDAGTINRTVWMLPTHSGDEESPVRTLTAHISKNELDQEDALCRHGKQIFTKFLDIFGKKCGLADYINLQESRIRQEISQLEDQRKRKIDTLLGTLATTTLTNSHLDTLQNAVEQLHSLAQDLHSLRPTISTNDHHFYQMSKHKNNLKTKAILTEAQQKELEAGLGTSRYHVANALTGLKQALAKQSLELSSDKLKALEKTVTQTQAAWNDAITEENPSTTSATTKRPALKQSNPSATENPIDYENLLPTTPQSTKPVFQGISSDQLQQMLGTIAQPPQKPTKLEI